MSTTEKQLKFLDIFCVRIAPHLGIAPSDPGTPGLLREVAAIQTAYLEGGDALFRRKADELLQVDKPRGVKIIGLAAELGLATGDLHEAAKHALWLADELEKVYGPTKAEQGL